MHFLNMFFFDIYPYIAGTVFWWEAGCVMTTASTPRAASSQMLDRKGMNPLLTCSTSGSWGFCGSLPRNADAALDV